MENEYRINHKYRDEIIVPYIAIHNNIPYLTKKGVKRLIFANGIKAEVIESRTVHICELEADIQRIYGITAWEFVKAWYKSERSMDSMFFVFIKVKKEEE